MKSPFLFSILFFLLPVWVLIFHVTPVMGASLDSNRVRTLLMEGELDSVKAILDQKLKKDEQLLSDPQKAFAYKYLGVIYAHSPEEQTKAEGYFYSLLRITPNARLDDLPISARIEQVFKKVKRRYKARHSPQSVSNNQSWWARKWVWWAGGMGALVLGTTTVLLLTNENTETIHYTAKR